jgi:murein DD-endopeptidase MepM/ murein hydrolase activator NlpD
MRSHVLRGVIAKALMSAAAAALLAGCSNSIERFSNAYNNPSDADPVYTASVPKPKRMAKPAYKRPVYEEPTFDQSSADDIIEETPIKRAAIPVAKPKDYASAYKPTYKQPTLKKPKLIPPPEEVAEAVEEPTQDFAPEPVKVVKAPFKKAAPKLIPPPEDDVALVEKPALKKKIQFNKPKAVETEEVADVEEPVTKKPVVAKPKVKLVEPKQEVAEVKPVVKSTKKPAPLSLAEDEERVADADPEVALVAKPKVKEIEKVAEAPPAPAGLNLRWPLKGKIISTYGNKPNGLKNEGINISVPEGTSVRAADSGVVAYAGNELKGYGNLILIRHPGGYVTAYAHAKELFVKRGDKIERGAVIAKAGQTGSVSSPQLHFEVRKGATALDPTKFLGSATASN